MNLEPSANSAVHPSEVGKWVPTILVLGYLNLGAQVEGANQLHAAILWTCILTNKATCLLTHLNYPNLENLNKCDLSN